MGGRVVEDLITGNAAKQHRASMRERKKLNELRGETKQKAIQKAFKGGVSGGKLCVHNKFRLDNEVHDMVEENILRKEAEALKVKVDKFEKHKKCKRAYHEFTLKSSRSRL